MKLAVDGQLEFNLLERLPHDLVQLKVALDYIHAVLHIAHTMLLQPIVEKERGLIGQVVIDESKFLDIVWLHFYRLNQLFEAMISDVILIKLEDFDVRLEVLICNKWTNAIDTPIEDAVVRIVNLLESSLVFQRLKRSDQAFVLENAGPHGQNLKRSRKGKEMRQLLVGTDLELVAVQVEIGHGKVLIADHFEVVGDLQVDNLVVGQVEGFDLIAMLEELVDDESQASFLNLIVRQVQVVEVTPASH